MYFALPVLVTLGLAALLPTALGATFGSCLPADKCGYMCCSGDEVCMDKSMCVGPSYVSSVIASYPSLASEPSRVESLLCALANPTGLSSVYGEYRHIMTDAPAPSDLSPTVPAGFTVPASLNPETMGPIPTTTPTKAADTEARTSEAGVETTRAPNVNATTAAGGSVNATVTSVPPIESANAAVGHVSTYGVAAFVAAMAAVVAVL
jgi:hypothetical protein